jgi:leader peptidase (prepilin peptidase) / N-methyltransferase
MSDEMVVLTGLFGLIFGSFFNVVAHRLPQGVSLVTPASSCPACGIPVKPYDNVPVLSWLWLRGRCRACSAPISVQYPLIEALTAVLAVAVVLVKHSAHDIALGLLLVAVLLPTALIDLEHRIIPNKITLPAAVGAICVDLVTQPSGVPRQLIAGAAAGGFLLVFALAYPRGMGMGDVKLAGVLGLYLGAGVAVALFVAVVAAMIVGVWIMASVGVRAGRKTAVPFGPFLALGGVTGLLAGSSIIHWYLHGLP